MEQIQVDEIILYQLSKKDRNRFNNHAWRSGIQLRSFAIENQCFFIYIPKKSLYKGSVILNQEAVTQWCLFEANVKKSEIKFYRKVYVEADFLKQGFV